MSLVLLATRLPWGLPVLSGKDKRTKDSGRQSLDHQDLPLSPKLRSCNGVSRSGGSRLESQLSSPPMPAVQQNSRLTRRSRDWQKPVA